jgi:hypothetical protein
MLRAVMAGERGYPKMCIARAALVLMCATSAASLGGCAASHVSGDAPPGISLTGEWRLNPAKSDDPQKILAQMRERAHKIMASASASGSAGPPHGAPPEGGGAEMAGAPGPGPHHDPLQRSPMAHIVENVLARGDYLDVHQGADAMVFDFGTSRRTFTPGAKSVVSTEGGVGDQVSGWHGRDFVIVVRPQNGPEVTERVGLSPDGKQLIDALHIAQYELPAVDLRRVYDPASTTQRQLPTAD